jgi:multiple antibiotic resistance protein
MAVPLFLSMTAKDDAPKRRRTALRAALACFVTLSLFAVTGGLLFRAFGITLGAFKIAGGLMLFLMAIDMMKAQHSRTRSTEEEEQEGEEKDDVAIVPMAIPFLAGPGAIATVMVMMSRAGGRPMAVASVFGAIAVTTLVTWLLLRSAASAERFLSKTMLNVMNRVFGLILAAVAVEFVIGGLRDLLPTMRAGAGG